MLFVIFFPVLCIFFFSNTIRVKFRGKKKEKKSCAFDFHHHNNNKKKKKFPLGKKKKCLKSFFIIIFLFATKENVIIRFLIIRSNSLHRSLQGLLHLRPHPPPLLLQPPHLADPRRGARGQAQRRRAAADPGPLRRGAERVLLHEQPPAVSLQGAAAPGVPADRARPRAAGAGDEADEAEVFRDVVQVGGEVDAGSRGRRW